MSFFDNIFNSSDFNFCDFSRFEERSSHPDIEDVEYQDVESPHEAPGFDKNAREKQLIDKAFSKYDELIKNHP